MNTEQDPDAVRKENIDDKVLSLQERLVFDSMTLHAYKKHRAARGLPPLTKWQDEALSAERLWHCLFAGEK